MNVLHIFHEINFSGAEIMYANAASLFQKENINLFALSTGEKEGDFVNQFKEQKIHVLHQPFAGRQYNPLKIYLFFKKLAQLIEKENIDIIHIHRYHNFWMFAVCGFLLKKKCIFTVHNVFKHRTLTWIKGFLERYIAAKYFNLITQSIGDSVYENELTYYKNPTIKINNWFDSNKFYPARSEIEREKLRFHLNLPSNSFIIISVGSCKKEKNHEDIIKSLVKLVKRIPQILYIHLGEGCLLDQEILLAEKLEVRHNVLFLGNIENVRDYLVSADIFIMPSKFEGLGISSIESMACRIPNILYNSPGLRDLIKNDDNGFLISHKYEEIVEKVYQYYENPLLARKKANNGHLFVNSVFLMNSNVKQIIDLYL